MLFIYTIYIINLLNNSYQPNYKCIYIYIYMYFGDMPVLFLYTNYTKNDS